MGKDIDTDLGRDLSRDDGILLECGLLIGEIPLMDTM